MTLVREPITGLWHDDAIRYPIGYGTEVVSLDTMIRRELGGNCHPEYRRRLVNVMIWHQGNMGIGDGWRPNPSNTSAASKLGQSLHQDQQYHNGSWHWSAADMVCKNPRGGAHVAPPTHNLPVQGTDAARIFGIHANVGTPGQSGWESWHAQCVEQDGWLTWVQQGRRHPTSQYAYPVLHSAPVTPAKDADMIVIEDTRVWAGHEDAAPPTTLFAIPVRGAVPAEATAAQATVTVVNALVAGYLSVNGKTSFCQYQPGEPRDFNRSFPITADGHILFGAKTPVDAIVDVTGYYL